MGRSLLSCWIVGALVVFPLATSADPVTTPLTGRDYDIDLHLGAARGSPRIIAMGGATAALAEGAGGLMGNPGAIARRPPSSPDRWDWDVHMDSFAPGIGSDFDNNGIPSNERLKANVGSGALLGFFGPWALGIGGQSVSYPMSPAGTSPAVPAADGQISAGFAHFMLARSFLDGALGIGGGVRIGDLVLLEGEQDVFDVFGAAVEAGVLVAAHESNWRWGLRLALPVRGDTVEARCDPSDCRGLVLPSRAVAPWEVALGAAFRLAASRWNTGQLRRFRDEPALVLSAELRVTGPLARAGGVEAFLARRLQRSGQATTLSPRLGLEKEWLPGRLRVRAGTYWEPARFEGVAGRLHVTAGGELRLFSFRFWGAERRVALALAIDGARRFGNAGLSAGFWH